MPRVNRGSCGEYCGGLEGGEGNRNPSPPSRVFGYFLHEQKVTQGVGLEAPQGWRRAISLPTRPAGGESVLGGAQPRNKQQKTKKCSHPLTKRDESMTTVTLRGATHIRCFWALPRRKSAFWPLLGAAGLAADVSVPAPVLSSPRRCRELLPAKAAALSVRWAGVLCHPLRGMPVFVLL